jgi:hypothetical protein
VDIWGLLAHQPNTDSGYSATLFKSKEDGSYVYAIRGTELSDIPGDIATDVYDIVTDGIAIDQLIDMYNHWQWLNADFGSGYQIATLNTLEAETLALAAERIAFPGSLGPGPVEQKTGSESNCF